MENYIKTITDRLGLDVIWDGKLNATKPKTIIVWGTGQANGEFAYKMKQTLNDPNVSKEDKEVLSKIYNEWIDGLNG